MNPNRRTIAKQDTSGGGGAHQVDGGDQPPSSSIPPPQREVPAPSATDGGGQTPNTPDPGSPPLPTPTAPNHFHSALLLGEDHIKLGEVAIREVTPNTVIAISRGRFPKGYAHVDPNEDAVFAATDGATTILAVADGHHGFDAARAAITAIAQTAPTATVEPAETIARTLAEAAIRAVAATVPFLAAPRNTSRTSLTICVIADDTVAAVTIGDTACYRATRRRATRTGTDSEFLSPETKLASIKVDAAQVRRNAAVVVTSDGLIDFAADPDALIRSIAGLGASDAVERLIDAAFAGGAGDNTAVAVFRRP